MAIWNTNLSNVHQSFAEAIFNKKFIECKATFCFQTRDYEWKGYFETRFRYLKLNEQVSLPNFFLNSYDDFVNPIEFIRDQIKCEYDFYFNELWC